MKNGSKIFGLVTVTIILSAIIYFFYPYAKSYTPIDTFDKREKILVKGEPTIYSSTGNWINDYKRMMANNFILLGTSNFERAFMDKQTISTLSWMIGAQIVIIDNQHADKSTTTLPYAIQIAGDRNQLQTRSDNQLSVPAAILGRTYGAQFWAHAKVPVFGANFSNLKDDDLSIGGVDQGIKINVVIRNSPASWGKIETNDIVTHIDGRSVRNVEDFLHVIQRKAGQKVTLSILRGKRFIELDIGLNQVQ